MQCVGLIHSELHLPSQLDSLVGVHSPVQAVCVLHTRRSVRTEVAGDALLLSLSHKQTVTVLGPARSRAIPAYERPCCCATLDRFILLEILLGEIKAHQEARCALSCHAQSCRIVQDVLGQTIER